ncbi:cache domain-containing protein [Azospirillum sp.]|uniref:cache domain-containing protein n=1 Tax=Azospirillum sp. TaxID=34012 RepID=UPI003D709B07
MRKAVPLILPLLLMAGAAGAADRSTPEQAKALVQEAAAYLKAKGPEEAVKAFHDPKGTFVRQDLYVFVFDTAGKYVASGANPKLAGTSASDLTDAEGKPLVQEMIARTRDTPEAALDYVWLNRRTNKVEHKHSYLIRQGDYIVGSGSYSQ